MILAFHDPGYAADIGAHVMPMRKFALVAAEVVAAGLPVEFRAPAPAADADLARVHTPAYVAAVATGQPRAVAESQKFPWSPELARAVRLTSGGCIAAAAAALDRGIAANVASGFHHAHADHGEGFCTFHGLVVAYERLRHEGRLRRVLVVDLDLHYGNGTAALAASRPDLHNLSIYGSYYEGNRPSNDVAAVVPATSANNHPVPVPNGADGAAYLEIVRAELPAAIERARPELVLYQAGADPYRRDPYSPLDVGLDDLEARDRLVFETVRRAGVPVAWVLAGGYTPDVSEVVAAHVGTFRAAAATFG